jgi:uncharacterized Zn-binding protein involved in type VI secretion
MPEAGRLGDLAQAKACAHSCPLCPHPTIGLATKGSPDVLINGMPALRVTDTGMQAPCCGPNTWEAKTGSQTVFINELKAHRKDDITKHCGGAGQLTQGSPNVLIGD